jgi:hypothetical protein
MFEIQIQEESTQIGIVKMIGYYLLSICCYNLLSIHSYFIFIYVALLKSIILFNP